MAMTDARRALINELLVVQNHEAHYNRDILTITGFMSDAQVRAHIDSCLSQAADYEVRKAARVFA